MPVDSTYQKYYGALQQAYGKDGIVEKGAFNLGYDDFKQKLSNQDYAQKIYSALDQAYGKQGIAEKGAFTLPFKDFYSKLTAPNKQHSQSQPIPIQQSNPNFDITPNPSPNVAHYQNPYDNLQSILLPHQGELITKYAHSDRVQKAANNITDVFNNNKDKAIVKIVSGDLSQKQRMLDASFQDGQIDEKTYKEQKKQLFGQMMNPAAAVNQFKQDMASDQGKVRQVVNEIANANPDKANQIKADMYVLDSKDRPQKAEKILSNTTNIEKGNTDYNIRTANLQNHEGFFSSLGQGFSERNRMMNDYDFYTGETPDKIIGKLEHQRNSYDPDEPVNAPYGIGGHLGQAIGSQGVVTAKGAISGGLTSLIPAVGEAAAPWVAAAVTSPEFYKTGYVSSLENEYHRLRNQGIPEDEALRKAKDKAEFDAKVDVAQGVLATAVGTRIGLKPTELPPTFQKSITNIAKHAGTWLGETGVEGSANAIIAGGLQELKNIHAGRPAEEGAFETGMGQLMFAYGLGALTKGGRALLNPKAYGSILRTMAKAPDEKVSAELANMVKSGSISPEDATDVHNQLTQQRAADSKIPDHITNDKDRAKIQELIGQRDELDSKLENLDKAYHPEIKEQIKTINEKIADLSKNQTEPTGKPSSEPTFKEPEDQTRLYINDQIQKGNKDWTKNDIYVNMAKQDPEGFMKFIADQSTPETRAHTEDIFGKEIVQKAIDLYHPKTEEHGKDQGRADEAQADQRQITQQEGAANAPSFEPTSWARTLDYGENKGKEENKSAQEKIKQQIINDEPIGETGERFSQLLGRVIPGIKKTIAEDPHNTTVVTHSSVIKVLKVWEEMGRPDISEIHGEKLKEFAQRYVDLKPEAEGKVHTFKGENGNEIKVVRHGETEDNKLSEFRQDNTQLTDKGVAQAKKAGENLAKETGANVPKIIYSDLPRTEHTSNIISDVLKEKQGEYPRVTNIKLKENALQVGRPEKVLQREPEQTGSAGSGRAGVEPSQQGDETSGARIPEEKGKGTGKEKVVGGDMPPTMLDLPMTPEEGEASILHHAATAEKRTRYGMEEQSLSESKSDIELEREAIEKINNGYDVDALIKRSLAGELPEKGEHTILKMYAAGLESKLEKLHPDSEEYWKIFDELRRTYKASETVGSIQGFTFRERRGMVLKDETLSDKLMRDMDAYGVDKLTDEQVKTVEKEHKEISESENAYKEKIAQLEADNAKLKAEAALKKEKESETKGTKKKKTHDEYVKERKDILADARKALLKAAKGGEGLTSSIPGLAQLAAITPHVKKMAKSLLSEGVEKLEDAIKTIHEQFKELVPGISEKDIHNIIAGEYDEKKPTERQLRTSLRDWQLEAQLVNKLEALEKGETPKTEKKKIQRNQKIAELRKQIKEHPETQLAEYKERLKKNIEEVQKQLDSGNFKKEEKEKQIALDKEAIDLQNKYYKLKWQREYRLAKAEYDKMPEWQKKGKTALEILNVPRTLMSSADFSAPLRQGLVATISHPKLAKEASAEMFKMAASKERFDKWFRDVKESDLYPIIQKSKLYVADPHNPELAAKEEAFVNNLAEKIPLGVGSVVAGSERAYVGYLNKMRVDLFAQGVERFMSQGKTIENSPELYEGLANYINTATGRGDLSKIPLIGKTLEKGSPLLSALFFSPRLIASRINLINPMFYSKLPKEVRIMALKDMGKTIAFNTALMTLGALAGWWKAEADPRSSDFGKIRVGNTRWDLFGGFSQYARVIAQLISGQTKQATTGRIVPLGAKGPFGRTRGDVLMQFFRGKLAPIPGAALDFAYKRKVTGEPVSISGEAQNLFEPLIYQDISDAWKDQGFRALFTVGIPSTFGVGVQTYQAKRRGTTGGGGASGTFKR